MDGVSKVCTGVLGEGTRSGGLAGGACPKGHLGAGCAVSKLGSECWPSVVPAGVCTSGLVAGQGNGSSVPGVVSQ